VFAVFATAVDPLGQLLKHGSGEVFVNSIKETYKNVQGSMKGVPKTEMQGLLDTIGIMERMFTREDLQATYNGAHLQPWGQKVADKFFTYNGVEASTNLSRQMNGFAGIMSVAMWARQIDAGGPEAAAAKDKLRMLGLTRDDITLNPATGNIKLMNWDERAALDIDTPEGKQAWDRDTAVMAAIHRFVDETTIRPNPTNRPLAASNPYYDLMMQWKGFIVAFDNQIFRPAWTHMAEDGNAKPILTMAATFIPVMFAADMLRDAVMTAFDDDRERPRWKDGWTLADHIGYAHERAGMLGRWEMSMNIIDPLMEGKIPKALTEFLGPASGDVYDISKWGFDEKYLPLGQAINAWG
jgi:hypothetical protein